MDGFLENRVSLDSRTKDVGEVRGRGTLVWWRSAQEGSVCLRLIPMTGNLYL